MVRRKDVIVEGQRIPDRYKWQLNRLHLSEWFIENEEFDDFAMTQIKTEQDLFHKRLWAAKKRQNEAQRDWIASQLVQPLDVSDATWNVIKTGNSSTSPNAVEKP